MDRASTRAGVPVFSRAVSKPSSTSASVSPVDGASPALLSWNYSQAAQVLILSRLDELPVPLQNRCRSFGALQ